jgi:hypothetical protein
MENALSPKLEKMLSTLRKEGSTRGDRLPYSLEWAEPEPDSELEPGLSLRALELLSSKIEAGAQLNDLEALGADLLRIMANEMSWQEQPPRPAPPTYLHTHHTAVIGGSYTIAGSLEGFSSRLEVELLSGNHAQLLDTRVASCTPKEGGPGLLVVDVQVVLTFTIRRKVGDAPLDSILAGMEACIKHPFEVLAPVPRMLRDVTTLTM